MSKHITLGDLKKLDLPDDTPIVIYNYDGAWDFDSINYLEPRFALGERDGENWEYAGKDDPKATQVILLNS